MKKIIQSLFKTTEERIKNPIVGAFLTSWILFNWKPILFILFSSKTIEEKIGYIQINFSSIYFLLIYPLISAIFYILILPYFNLLIDELLKYSLIRRNTILINKQKQSIGNQKELAIEEIKLEEAKTDFRERNSHNKLVEDLQNKIKELEVNSEREMTRNEELLFQLKRELEERKEIASNEIKSFERQYSNTRKEIMQLNEQLFEKDKIIQELQLNYINESSRVIYLPNGRMIVEQVDGNKKYYYNPETRERYNENEFQNLIDETRKDK